MRYKVTYAIDSLDPNPVVEIFDAEWEALDWLHDEVSRRVEYLVQHSPYAVSEEDYADIEETEYSLTRIEKLEP